MKKYLTLLFGVFLVLALSGLVYAQSDKNEKMMDESGTQTMTYGQCVSQHAETKNTCYANVKSALKTCTDQAAEDATGKDATKQCGQTYKKDKADCKKVFKDSKRNECAQIKHNFLETMRYMFK